MGVSTAPEQHRRGLRCRWEPLDVEAVAPATSVAVMAPALTESGPQKLDDLLPPLPSSGFLTQEQAAQVCQNREVLAKFVVSANVQPTKIDEQCLRGISKELIRDVINSKYGNGLDSLSSFANSSDLIASKLTQVEAKEKEDKEIYNNYKEDENGKEQEQEEEEEEKNKNKLKKEEEEEELKKNIYNKEIKKLKQSLILTDCKLIDVSDAIMNESSISDNNEKEMGFIKTSEIVPMINDDTNDCSSIDKDIVDDVNHIMELNNDLTTNVAGDIDSNVDDLLQAIKSMEGETVNDSNIVNDDTHNIFPITDGFTSFDERVLLNDVMNSFVNDNININDTIIEQQVNNTNLLLQQKNIQDKQFKSERKCAFLQRRLRKIQTKLIGRHIAEENTGVIEIAHNSVKKYFHQEFENIRANKIGNVDYKLPDIGGNIDTFLQKIEKSCLAQSNSVNRQRMSCRYFGAGSRDNYTTGTGSHSSNNHHRYPVFGQAKIKIDGNEIENLAGSLANNLHTVQLNLDSDCTASSSGGESCDEMQTFNNLQQHQLPITKRAAWQYVQDRAGIAARWTWLQAQITDLEYRIRHHNELQRQIRSTKGHVVLENIESINGYNRSSPGNSNTPIDQTESCCRTRPFIWESYRKRKLIRVDGLHEYSKRAAKSTNIRCNCDHGLLPSCALCTGRTDPTQPQEPHEQLSLAERIAFVDTCYHPVLSFPDEVSQNTHFDAIMKSSDWQQKTLRGNLTRLPRIKDKDLPERRNSKTKLSDNRAKYSSSSSRIKKSSTTILTDRIKKKILKGKGGNDTRPLHGTNRKKLKVIPSIESGTSGTATASIGGDDDVSAHSNSSKHSSPVPSPLHHTITTTITPTTSTDKLPPKEKSSNSSHGRLRQSSYDINNIVIPYSVAASMKPEKLQYKEILTPKWRLCGDVVKQDVRNGVVHRLSQDSDSEDVTDEAIALRHERSEREENKRYMKGANRPQGRLRNHRRADSRADSGANTPDPMSPQTGDFGGDVTSPPATPLSVQDSEHNNTMDGQRNSLQYAMRRRTFSSSMRIGREESGNLVAEDVHEVLPYDPRLFPLSEEVYEKMLEVMPDGHWQASPGSLCLPEEEKRDDDAEVDSHESDATESAYCDADGDVEDPNDPEWTVADVRDAEKERIRPTAKR